MKPLSIQVRLQIVNACDAGEGTRQEIAERYGVSLGMVKKLLAQRKRLGILEPQNHRCGRKSILSEKDLLWLRKTVEQGQDLTLKKLCRAFKKPCSVMTISRGLQKLRAVQEAINR
jgi:transposase